MPVYPKRYDHIDFSPPEGARDAARRGVRLFEQGFGGDGLEDVTIREARAISRGELPTIAKIRKATRFWGRNERFLDVEDHRSAAWTSAMLWGGRSGMRWFRKLTRQMEAADARATESGDMADGVELGDDDFRWVPALQMGYTAHPRHPDGGYTVTPELVQELQRFLTKFTGKGYFPPVRFLHASQKASPMRHGRVNSLRQVDNIIEFGVEFARGVADLYDGGFLDGWSPTLWWDWTDPHDGEKFAVGLRDLSAVDVPWQKHLPNASPHYTVPLGDPDDTPYHLVETTEGGPMEETAETTEESTTEAQDATELMELLRAMSAGQEAMMAAMAEMREAVKAMMPPADTTEETAAGDGEVHTEAGDTPEQTIAVLQRQLAEERGKRLRSEITTQLGDIAEDQMNSLVELGGAQPALYQQTLNMLGEARKATIAAQRTSTTETGNPGDSVGGGATELGDVLAEAAKGGVPRGAKLIKFVRGKGLNPEHVNGEMIATHYTPNISTTSN